MSPSFHSVRALEDRYDVTWHHDQPPEGLWVAWGPPDLDGWHHTYVCEGRKLYHDPAGGWVWTGDLRSPIPDVLYGCSLERRC